VPGISVSLPDSLSRLALPEPPNGHELRDAVRASLRFLEVAPDRITGPLLAGVYRAPLATADFSEHLGGPTGTKKTSLALLCQQHWGGDVDEPKKLPGSWSSTGNSLEALAFAAKDMVLVVDDFAPHGSQHDVARYHRDADRVFRAQGNQSGRQRMRPDGSLRPVKPPRGLILSTGEDTPKGQSLRARLLIMEVSPDEVDLKKLTDAQADAAAGKYAKAMAGYIQWLAQPVDRGHAPRIAGIRRRLPGKVAALRSEHRAEGQHARTPGIAADLFIGWDYFLRFAVDCGAISADSSDGYLRRITAALKEVCAEQAEHVQAAEPCGYFLRLLAGAVASGQAHVAGIGGGCPSNAAVSWGWRETDPGSGNWQAQGRKIGWVEGNNLYLSPEAAFAEAQSLAAKQGDSLAISPRTLWKRLKERRLLASSEQTRTRNTVRRTIENVKDRECVHLHASSLITCARPSEPSAKREKSRETRENSADGSADSRSKTRKNRPHDRPQK
jgi:hypothetical protein